MSLEDLFQKKLCICNHSIEEEHFNGTCYALDFNGTIYSACDCRHIKTKPLVFKVERVYEDNNSNNRRGQKNMAGQKAKINILNWGANNKKNSSAGT